MKSLQRTIAVLAMPMAFIIPFWLTFGRAMLGSGGWLALIMLSTVAPMLFAYFVIVYALVRTRPDVRETKLFGQFDSILHLAVYSCLFLVGLFLVDGGDTVESVGSVVSKLGLVSTSLSEGISAMFTLVSMLLMLILLIFVVVERTKKKEIGLDKPQTQPTVVLPVRPSVAPAPNLDITEEQDVPADGIETPSGSPTDSPEPPAPQV